MTQVSAPEGVVVWLLELDTTAPFGYLSPDEQARAARFRFERDRRRYQVCRSALRVVLGERLQVPPEELEFTYGPQGKPECAGATFNVSHSNGLALIALGADGVDIEEIRHDIEPQNLGRSVFTPTELSHIHSVEDFFLAWTAKEALIKAEGGGFSSPLLQRTVWPALEPALAERFTLVRLDVPPGFAAALALQNTKKAARQLSGGS